MRKLLYPVLLFLVITGCGKKGGETGSLPEIRLADVTIAEGTGANTAVAIKVSLAKTYSSGVSVYWSTTDGTAKSGEDYIAVTSQELNFAAGETEKTIAVTIVRDDIKEADEYFIIQFSKPVNGLLLGDKLRVTLTNDDTKIAFSNTGYDAPNTYAGYTLAWSDEFNSTSLDAASWSFESGDGCPIVCNWGNNELQYYTNTANNHFFQDGKLVVEARSETYGGKNYTSARINTRGKKAFKFGRVDVRAILPVGKGIWPAFWLMPQDNVFGDWPKSGEIDMMEYIGSEPSKVLGTVHFGPGPSSTYITKTTTIPTGTFNDRFHVFSLEWEADQIRWLIDGSVYASFTKAEVGANNYPFNESFYFILNMAVGGNLPGNPDATTTFPKHLVVDYVRIYQK